MYKILFDKDPKCGLKVQALLTIMRILSTNTLDIALYYTITHYI